MSKAKTVTINKTLSKSVSKLEKGNKYYIQIRTYKSIKGVQYFSNWSAKKSVVTKK